LVDVDEVDLVVEIEMVGFVEEVVAEEEEDMIVTEMAMIEVVMVDLEGDTGIEKMLVEVLIEIVEVEVAMIVAVVDLMTVVVEVVIMLM